MATRIQLSRRLSDYVATACIITFATFYIIPILIGWATGIMTVPVNVIGGAVLTLVITLGVCWRTKKPVFSTRSAVSTLLSSGEWVWVALAPVALLLLLELHLGLGLPGGRYVDAKDFHIGAAMEWYVTGRFDLTMFGYTDLKGVLAQWMTYPNIKAVFPWLVLEQTQQKLGTALTQWPWQLLLSTTVFAIARRCGVSRFGAMLSVLCCLTMPELFLQSLEAYSDINLTAAISAVIFTTLVFAGRNLSIGTVLVAVMAWALMAGSKNSYVVVAAVFGPVVLAVLIRNAPVGRKTVVSVLTVLAIIVACWLVSGSWLLRSYALYENPLYPQPIEIGGHEIFKGIYGINATKQMITQFVGVPAEHTRWVCMFGWANVPHLADRAAGFGLHSAILGLPALFLMMCFGLLRSSSVRAMAGKQISKMSPVSVDVVSRRLLVLMLLGWYLICPANMMTRYVMSLVILVAVATAWVLTHLPAIPRALVTIALLCCIGFNCFTMMPSYYYRAYNFDKLAYDYLSSDEMTMGEETYPDCISPLEVWQLSVAKPGMELAVPRDVHGNDFRVWRAFVPKKGIAYCFFPPCESSSKNDVEPWVELLRSQGVTHLYIVQATQEWEIASKYSQYFERIFSTQNSSVEIYTGAQRMNTMKPEMGTLFALRPSEEVAQ